MDFTLLQDLILPRRGKKFLAWQTEITTRCPLSCGMCIRQGLPDWRAEDMSLADFTRLVPYFSDVGSIILQGWGEPLLHKDLVPIIRAAKDTRRNFNGPMRLAGSLSPDVGFITSGKGLDRRYASEIIDAGLDFIGFSFAGCSASTHEAIRVNSGFNELIASVQALNVLKQRKATAKPRVHIVYLLLRDNIREAPELPRLARDMGVGGIILTNLIHVTTAWQDSQRVFSRNDDGEAEAILKETETRAREAGIHLTRPSLTARNTPLCEENPLRNLYVSSRGDVSPCVYLHPPAGPRFKRIFCGQECEAGQVSFGNIFEAPLERIWDSAEYREFRDRWGLRAQKVGKASPRTLGRQEEYPESPPSCRTCHKMLGL